MFSGLTDGCINARRAGCKLIEITGDNASENDVKALDNNALDVLNSLLRVADHTNKPLTSGHSGTLLPRI